jgi:hypothetical protein
MLQNAVDHFIQNVIPAADDYNAAEDALSHAYRRDPQDAAWAAEARLAKRKAAELAIAARQDGCLDRRPATPSRIRRTRARLPQAGSPSSSVSVAPKPGSCQIFRQPRELAHTPISHPGAYRGSHLNGGRDE